MYEVVQDLMVKVQGIIKTFPTGSIVNLPEKSAQMFIRQGKIKPAAEEPLTGYELAERTNLDIISRSHPWQLWVKIHNLSKHNHLLTNRVCWSFPLTATRNTIIGTAVKVYAKRLQNLAGAI